MLSLMQECCFKIKNALRDANLLNLDAYEFEITRFSQQIIRELALRFKVVYRAVHLNK